LAGFGRRSTGGIGAGLAQTRATPPHIPSLRPGASSYAAVAELDVDPSQLENAIAAITPTPPDVPDEPVAATPPASAMSTAIEKLDARDAAASAQKPSGDSFDGGIHKVKEQVLPRLLERIDAEAAAQLGRDDLMTEFRPIIFEVLAELRITLNRREHYTLEKVLVDELLGLGPLETLIDDPSVSDIMVNGPKQIYVERKGRLEITDVAFRDEQHLLQIAQRICNRIGRRIDQTSPLADARLEDGSRVNIIVPPLSLKGTAISVRKFSAKPITLDMMAAGGSCSTAMATALKIASASRLNIVVSGGTGSGKTTLLNALSKMIDPGERVITIEDAAELRLQQPHVVTLETRPANLEGMGAITIRDLVINALRMRPDRIILGEIRGGECMDMLQAMNTGHDGSMCTLHSNQPREAISRMENMVAMSGINHPLKAVRQQIVEAVDMVVQVRRLRDGSRRITSITEVTGMEGEVVVMQELFKFEYLDEAADGKIIGEFRSTGLRPHSLDKVRQYGFEQAFLEACL
jgi:pilus assembly protein CpaF